MAIDHDKILNWPFPPVEQTYTERDTILYALGLGLGADPMDEDELRFVFEESDGFAALPSLLPPPGPRPTRRRGLLAPSGGFKRPSITQRPPHPPCE